MKIAICFIDDCTNPADLILWAHPDPVILCRDHRSFHAEDEWALPTEVLVDMEGAVS